MLVLKTWLATYELSYKVTTWQKAYGGEKNAVFSCFQKSFPSVFLTFILYFSTIYYVLYLQNSSNFK